VSALTLIYRKVPNDAEIGAVSDIVHEHAGTIRWQVSRTYDRAYALVENAGAGCIDALGARTAAAFNASPIIALAVVPSVAEALPPILHALAGPGAPAGIRSCEAVGEAAIVEWNLDLTGSEIVLGLVDTEIARFHARRVNELLSPLPLRWVTRIAATGLNAPEIAPDRVLEALLETPNVGH
jgi:hypothetical protein